MIRVETERLNLREFISSDEAGLFELDSDPEVLKYLNQKPFTSINQSRELISYLRQQYAENGIGRWAVIEKQTNEFIGWSGLKLIRETINNHTNYYDIGYRLIKRFWGKGYATESAKAAIRYGFETLAADTIYGMCHINNSASKNALEKVGLEYVETFDLNRIPHHWFKTNNF
jgi:ribosomal-protein-alanine N-acetyltransferase